VRVRARTLGLGLGLGLGLRWGPAELNRLFFFSTIVRYYRTMVGTGPFRRCTAHVSPEPERVQVEIQVQG
jgi:hypothetical protein